MEFEMEPTHLGSEELDHELHIRNALDPLAHDRMKTGRLRALLLSEYKGEREPPGRGSSPLTPAEDIRRCTLICNRIANGLNGSLDAQNLEIMYSNVSHLTNRLNRIETGESHAITQIDNLIDISKRLLTAIHTTRTAHINDEINSNLAASQIQPTTISVHNQPQQSSITSFANAQDINSREEMPIQPVNTGATRKVSSQQAPTRQIEIQSITHLPPISMQNTSNVHNGNYVLNSQPLQENVANATVCTLPPTPQRHPNTFARNYDAIEQQQMGMQSTINKNSQCISLPLQLQNRVNTLNFSGQQQNMQPNNNNQNVDANNTNSFVQQTMALVQQLLNSAMASQSQVNQTFNMPQQNVIPPLNARQNMAVPVVIQPHNNALAQQNLTQQNNNVQAHTQNTNEQIQAIMQQLATVLNDPNVAQVNMNAQNYNNTPNINAQNYNIAPNMNAQNVNNVPNVNANNLNMANQNNFIRRIQQVKPTPPSQWKISFSGEEPKGKDELNVFDFIEQCEMFKEAGPFDDVSMIQNMGFVLIGAARQWYLEVRRNTFTWLDFVCKFKTRFLSTEQDYDLLNEIANRKQRKDESVGTYITDMKAKMRNLSEPLSERYALFYIKNGLTYSNAMAIAALNIRTIDEIEQTAKRIESARASLNANKKNSVTKNVHEIETDVAENSEYNEPEIDYIARQRYAQNNSTAAQSNRSNANAPKTKLQRCPSNPNAPACFNCDEKDHKYFNCPKPPQREFCYICGKHDITALNCDHNKKNVSEVAAHGTETEQK